jgi:hypothetical protein
VSVYKLSNVGGLKTKTAYTSFLAGNSQYVPPTYEAIATTTLATSTANISFSSIPAGYTHLQLRITGWNTSGSDRSLAMYYNSDTGINYVNHFFIGNGSTATAGPQTGRGQTFIFDDNSGQRGFNGDTLYRSSFVIDILDYANTNKNKTIRGIGGWDANGSGNVGIGSSLWMSTAAINSITLFLPYSTNFGAGTKASLYGIRSI